MSGLGSVNYHVSLDIVVFLGGWKFSLCCEPPGNFSEGCFSSCPRSLLVETMKRVKYFLCSRQGGEGGYISFSFTFLVFPERCLVDGIDMILNMCSSL